MTPLLAIENLDVRFKTPNGVVNAVNGLDLSISAGECVGIVGESGAGKSQIFVAVMGLLARNGRACGSARFQDQELIGLEPRVLNRIRGDRIAMIFQDPMAALNPYLRVSLQLSEVLVTHRNFGKAAARAASLEMLERVRIPDAGKRFDRYPHEFSGGMRQRVMIAMALLCQPDLLIADEPTTALDVTVQAEIIELLRDLRASLNTAIVLVTHDLGVVAGLCDRIVVVYAGRIVETGPVDDVFHNPQHPYTQGLLRAMPRMDEAIGEELRTIPGQPPDPTAAIPGCAFVERCGYRLPICATTRPELRAGGADRMKACHLEQP